MPSGITRRVQYTERYEASINPIQMPSPDALERLAVLYPDAPAVIFGKMRSQAEHRRAMEHSVVETKNKLAIRGQIIGGILGGIGLTGSLVVAGLGNGLAGFGIAMSSLLGLVSVFVLGQNSLKEKLAANAAIREQIGKGEPIEAVEKPQTVPKRAEPKPKDVPKRRSK